MCGHCKYKLVSLYNHIIITYALAINYPDYNTVCPSTHDFFTTVTEQQGRPTRQLQKVCDPLLGEGDLITGFADGETGEMKATQRTTTLRWLLAKSVSATRKLCSIGAIRPV
jgi:hypothetical protein